MTISLGDGRTLTGEVVRLHPSRNQIEVGFGRETRVVDIDDVLLDPLA